MTVDALNLPAEERPWGYYEVLHRQPGIQIKMLGIAAGEETSLQYHEHRSEQWIIMGGIAQVTRGNDMDDLTTEELPAGTLVNIPLGMIHRISNPTSNPVTILEIQRGEDLRESDIVRLEDKYGRTAVT